MNETKPPSEWPSKRKLTWKARVLLVLFGIGVALLLLAAFEGILRLSGYGKPDAFFIDGPEVAGRGRVHVTSREWARRFFFKPVRGMKLPPGSNVPQSFFSPKPPGAIRVAIVGESTVQGFPYPQNLSISKYLEEMLRDAAPGRDVQVFNFGFTAVASYPVSRIVGEIAEPTQCDAIVILVGHNEFFGAYGVASSQYAGSSRRLLALHEAYSGLRFVKLLRAGLTRASEQTTDSEQARSGLIHFMAADDAIGPKDPRRAQAAELLAANVAWSIRACKERGIPVLVGTMPSNLSGYAPAGHSPDAKSDTESKLADIMKTTDEVSRPAALEALLAQDSNSALLWYRVAQSRETGDAKGAHEAYVRARDLDGMPWRAPSMSNDALRRVAKEEGAVLVDCEAAFAGATKKAAPGWDFFDDHVHPSVRGRALYARTIAKELLPVLHLEGGASNLQDDPVYDRRLGGDNLLSVRQAFGAARSIFQDSPLVNNNEQVNDNFTRLMDQMDSLMSPEEKEAWETYQKLLANGGFSPPLGLIAGTLLMQHGKQRQAIYQLQIARRACPVISLSFVQAAWTEGHCHRILNEPLPPELERDLETSLMVLDVLPQIDTGEEYPLLKSRGQIYWVQERFDQAIEALEKALAAAKTDGEKKETQDSIAAIRGQMKQLSKSGS